MRVLDRVIAHTLPFVPKPLVRKVANRYIAGETLDEALRVTAALNRNGVRATLDILGEDVHNLGQAQRGVHENLQLLEEIHRRKLDANLSIKLTQLGLKADPNACLEFTARVVRRAEELGNFVRIDMEDSSCTTDTLQIYRTLRKTHQNVGVVIQAYLRRTLNDVSSLEDLRPNYRLCKGVYVEPPEIAFQDMAEINRNYIRILEKLLRGGSYVGIATHDELIVREALRLIRELRLPPTAYEFQMLLGVGEQMRDVHRNGGHHLRAHLPVSADCDVDSLRRVGQHPRSA